MASNDANHRRGNSTPQSIPLQDLTRPPGEGRQRRSTIGERGRNLMRRRDGQAGHYEQLDERSPSSGLPPTLRIITPSNTSNRPPPQQYPHANIASPVTPLDDPAAFQQATGFAGLSFHGEHSAPIQRHPGRNGSLPSFVLDDGYETTSLDDRDDAYDLPPSHAAPFRDVSYNLRPPNSHTPIGQRHDRIPSNASVRFSPLEGPVHTPGGMLGDDLANVEAGFEGHMRRSSSLKRGGLSPISAGSTLQRAGTMMRAMSQRIVNVSNESGEAVVDRGIRRKSSVHRSKSAEMERLTPVDDLGGDGAFMSYPQAEKQLSQIGETYANADALKRPFTSNPLKGNSLGIFSPNNPIRRALCDVLVHPVFEPFIFILILAQLIILTIDAASSVYEHPRRRGWGQSWIDYALLALFVVYSVEMVIRVIVSGFFINPREYSTIDRDIGFKKALELKFNTLFALEHERAHRGPSAISLEGQTAAPGQSQPAELDVSGDYRHQQRARLAYRAYLRHSFNRLDFLAVVAFWICFALDITGLEYSRHAYIFRMLSCLRIIRLLAFTSGTAVILQSLKKSAPMLVNVAVLIGFFWLLFAIIGMQAFKSSLRRECVWVDPDKKEANFTNSFQFCGGHLLADGTKMPWILPDGSNGSTIHKGFLCPINSFCVQGDNPYNGTVSFDNIVQSLELVFVVMSSNTFSDLMYYLMDSDYLAAALFFAAGIVFLCFWLVNLLIAVITSSFQVIREESKKSAFTGEKNDVHDIDETEVEGAPRRRTSKLKALYNKTKIIWVIIIAFDLVVMCLRSASMKPFRRRFIDTTETVVTIILLFEIMVRLVVDWRRFFKSKRNIADLVLALVTTIIQLPQIRNSGQVYAWLTIFQIGRIYRVIIATPFTRDLVLQVLGNMSGLGNLIMFVVALNWIASIFASQMFRGEIPYEDSSGDVIRTTFFSFWNSFLGMYQIFSSENWTSIVYTVTGQDVGYHTAWIAASFFILWFILANFIVLNMFIAVIQENFDVSEDVKRLEQVKAFLNDKDIGTGNHGNLSLSTIFKFSLATGKRRDPLAFGSQTTELLLKGQIVKDFLDHQHDVGPMSPPLEDSDTQPILRPGPVDTVQAGAGSRLWARIKAAFKDKEPNPFYSRLEISKAQEELDPTQMAREVVSAREKRKRAQREYLRKHPSYNVSLFTFKPDNPIRKICQRIVGPGRGGDRIEGVAPSVPIWYAFSFFIYCAILAMVLLACVTTPVYQRQYFQNHKFSVQNWFVFTDLGFAILFTVEAFIKVIADGFFWTPNAYFRGAWGFIDGVVLITLWVNVATALFNEGQVSRAVGAFKALRALRLLNVSDSARNTFHSVIVRGGFKVFQAAAVSLGLLIPFAIYGLNIFHGRMQACNDGTDSIVDLNDCVGEYLSTPSNWDVLAPRQASNPYFDFDNFGSSLFILFQIVSQEGWIDVQWAAQSVTGVFKQPQPFANQFNAIFFVVFNLLGAVFVLTLFVSVFMRNYTEQTGVAFLTADQRSWLELRKLLRQISPSKRPRPNRKRQTWQEWCYRKAVTKAGPWQRFVNLSLIFHLALLCAEFYPSKLWWDRLRDGIFFLLTLLFTANIFIRIVGLGWKRFRNSTWDMYSVFAVGGTFISSILLFSDFNSWVFVQVHKLFLVTIALMLIPRNNQLDQLFKTAAASLPWIANLMAAWFVLFLVYAIALTQTFGLTRFGGGETDNINFRNVPKALIFLFRISVGEGWNQFMEDFARIEPPFCTDDNDFLSSDCGGKDWARALFISWNILSMYIFVNLFVSLIYESFSYVYQRSSGLSVISREETRRFKQAWAEYDPEGTGYITKEQFPKLLGELSGVWEMRIYDGDFTIARIIEDCSKDNRESHVAMDGLPRARELDLKKLNARLADLPVAEIRKRRSRMNKFYEEVLVSSDPERGINFTTLLVILAHYKVINDNKSLRLKEFLRRRARLQRVDEAVRRNVVRGFFDTVFWARRFRRNQQSKTAGRMDNIPQFTVPEIFIDDGQGTPVNEMSTGFDGSTNPFLNVSPVREQSRSRAYESDDSSMPGMDGAATPLGSEGTNRSRANSIQNTPQASPIRTHFADGSPGRPSLHRPGRSDASMSLGIGLNSRPVSPTLVGSDREGGDTGMRSRANSNVSVRDMLDVLDDSAWGESIRRSFTMRRPS